MFFCMKYKQDESNVIVADSPSSEVHKIYTIACPRDLFWVHCYLPLTVHRSVKLSLILDLLTILRSTLN